MYLKKGFNGVGLPFFYSSYKVVLISVFSIINGDGFAFHFTSYFCEFAVQNGI